MLSSTALSTQTSLFSKAELSHLKLLSSPFQHHHNVKEALTALTSSRNILPIRVQPTRAAVSRPRSASRANQTDLLDLFLSFFHRNSKMAHESQEVDDKMWPSHVEHIFIEIMLEEQLKGNMPNGVFKGPTWASITAELNQRTGKNLLSKQVVQKHNRLRLKQCKWTQLLRHTGLGWDEQTQTVTCPDEVWENVIAGNRGAANLRKQGCPDCPSLQQLFAPSTATGSLQISSNTPSLNSDEERALEEELANANANASAPTHLDDDCYTPNFDSFPQTVEDAEVEEVTQRAGKRPVQDASGKGKKVSKKSDRVSDMTAALKEYTAMSKDRFSGKLGRTSGSSE